MESALSRGSLPFGVLISLVFAPISFFALNQFPPSQIIPCTDTWATNLALSLTLVFALQVFLAPKILPKHYKPFLTIHGAVILLVLWLGLYPISPLGYGNGKIPALRGFHVIRANRDSVVGVNEVISLTQGVAVGINPIMLRGDFECSWISVVEGALDDPSSCDTTYVPPAADYDILRLRLRPTCGLPESTVQLKISILP